MELAYRDEIGPKRKAVRILGQISDKAYLLGDAAKKRAADEEIFKVNEQIKNSCNDALKLLNQLPELDPEKTQRLVGIIA